MQGEGGDEVDHKAKSHLSAASKAAALRREGRPSPRAYFILYKKASDENPYFRVNMKARSEIFHGFLIFFSCFFHPAGVY